MNEVLNNIFDEESMEAIKNANQICPSPETLQAKEEVKYEEIEAKPVEDKIDYDMNKLERVEKENRELRIKVEAQKELIHKIIESQNQMIKEINKMQNKLAEFEAKEAQAPAKPVEQAKAKEPAQQTGAGEGLNPDDFSVENIFYNGN